MKKILLIALCLTPLFADLSIGQMETMVEKIKAKRKGSNLEKNPHFISPFVTIQVDENKTVIEEPETKTVSFVLGGIMNNKAHINEAWIRLGEEVEGYKLIKLGEKSAKLVQGDREIQIYVKKSKQIIQLMRDENEKN